MIKHTYLNLASTDIDRVRTFYQALGFEWVKEWSDSSTCSFKVNESTYLMIMDEPKFKGFTQTKLPNSHLENEFILSLEVDTKQAVDTLLSTVLNHGGSEFGAANDSDFMYYRAFQDPDGHRLEIFYFKHNNAI